MLRNLGSILSLLPSVWRHSYSHHVATVTAPLQVVQNLKWMLQRLSLQILQAALQQNSLLAFQTTRTQQLMPESSSSQEQLRQEHLLLPTKLLSLLFLRVQNRGVLQKT